MHFLTQNDAFWRILHKNLFMGSFIEEPQKTKKKLVTPKAVKVTHLGIRNVVAGGGSNFGFSTDLWVCDQAVILEIKASNAQTLTFNIRAAGFVGKIFIFTSWYDD